MLLDHNTKAKLAWGEQNNADFTLINNHLSSLGWIETPRLIDANEISGIVNAIFISDDGADSPYANIEIPVSSSWLFDHTDEYYCTSSNNCIFDENVVGYWTSTYFGGENWEVSRNFVTANGVWTGDGFIGIRPVITVSKYKF